MMLPAAPTFNCGRDTLHALRSAWHSSSWAVSTDVLQTGRTKKGALVVMDHNTRHIIGFGIHAGVEEVLLKSGTDVFRLTKAPTPCNQRPRRIYYLSGA